MRKKKDVMGRTRRNQQSVFARLSIEIRQQKDTPVKSTLYFAGQARLKKLRLAWPSYQEVISKND